jgi:hypothetical protein
VIDLVDVDLAAKYPGIVVPAHFQAPPFVRTLGPEVAAVSSLAGFYPDPEQLLGLDVTFSRDEHGKSAASEIVCLCCRQNMKTGLIKMIELGWLFVTDERLVVHSAHEFNTSREAYRDMKELIEGSSILLSRIKPGGFKDTPADMSIETWTGARLVFKTRTKGGGRGLSGRKVVLDEAFALRAMHMGALRPLISAQPDPQLVYASSGCLEDSEVEHTLVKRGRGGREPRLGYIEYCMPDPAQACGDGEACRHVYGVAVDCGLDNVVYLKAANPAIGRRIAEQTILDERRACVSEELAHEFGRERGGWHDAPAGGESVLDLVKWKEQVETGIDYAGDLALAFDVQPGNVGSAIVALGRLKVDVDVIAQALDLGLDTDVLGKFAKLRGEITGVAEDKLDNRSGTHWLVDRLVEICMRQPVAVVAYEAASPASGFRQALLDYRTNIDDPNSSLFVEVGEDDPTPFGKVRLVAVGATEHAQACSALDADIRNGRIRNYGQTALDQAVEGARSKPAGDGGLWKFSRRDSTVNLAPLVAFTVARHVFLKFGERKSAPMPWAMSL